MMLARNIQTSHSDLASQVPACTLDVIDISTVDRFQQFGTTALSAIDAEINRQAAMIAYIDDFYLMMWVTAAALPFILLMRRPPQRPRP